MIYKSISVREVIDRINAINDIWCLPNVQRGYSWGSRATKKYEYFRKLFDSLFKGYPIGTFLVWNTGINHETKLVPSTILPVEYHKFMESVTPSSITTSAPESLWDRQDKALIYDGQQRLQTIFSGLRFEIFGRKLAFNISTTKGEIGFDFKDPTEPLQNNFVWLETIITKTIADKPLFISDLQIKNPLISTVLIDENITQLFKVFNDITNKNLEYCELDCTIDEKAVNEIFVRINTGGMELEKTELVMSRIKSSGHPSFERELWKETEKIEKLTGGIGNGYIFPPSEIIKVMHLIVKKSTRVDIDRLTLIDIDNMIKTKTQLFTALEDFFGSFFYGLLKINNNALIRDKNALLPLIIFVYKKAGSKYPTWSPDERKEFSKLFATSQYNLWGLVQGIIDNVSKHYLDINGSTFVNYSDIIDIVKKWKKRIGTDVTTKEVENPRYRNFSLKLLFPDIEFRKKTVITAVRYTPEIDHIFPKYKNKKIRDVLWNLQPLNGAMNNIKSSYEPVHYFTEEIRFKDKATNKYIRQRFCNCYGYYKFVPQIILPIGNVEHDETTVNKSVLSAMSEWKNDKALIAHNKTKMRKFFNDNYGFNI